MSERVVDLRPRLLNGLLLPVLFAVSVAAAVIGGDRSGSFWVGLLAFLVAWKAGRVLRRLIRGRVADAVHAALWPAGATGFAILFVWAGLPEWLGVLLAMLVAEVAKVAIAASFLPERKRPQGRWAWLEEWDVPGLDGVIEGRWTRKEE